MAATRHPDWLRPARLAPQGANVLPQRFQVFDELTMPQAQPAALKECQE